MKGIHNVLEKDWEVISENSCIFFLEVKKLHIFWRFQIFQKRAKFLKIQIVIYEKQSIMRSFSKLDSHHPSTKISIVSQALRNRNMANLSVFRSAIRNYQVQKFKRLKRDSSLKLKKLVFSRQNKFFNIFTQNMRLIN